MPHVVSIHAPARGATRSAAVFIFEFLFQSTRPRGARRRSSLLRSELGEVSIHAPARGATSTSGHSMRWLRKFQSTRPRGARRDPPCRSRGCACFNPRAREGRDHDRARLVDFGSVSIHAPARGATAQSSRSNSAVKFQSTRPRGARPFLVDDITYYFTFQSTRPRGARPADAHEPEPRPQFQSTRPRGARRLEEVGKCYFC